MSILRHRYQTIEFGTTDIHLKTLRNRQEFSDPDDIAAKLGISSANWSLFGVVWASGEVLARLMLEYDIKGKRILEIGCGIGLASLVLNSRSADITATDYHPDAEKLLIENTKLNSGETIPFVRASWTDPVTSLGRFDTIIGADLLYEEAHANDLTAFIEQHAKPHCNVIIIDPGRKHHARFSKLMIANGYSYSCEEFVNMNEVTQPTRGCHKFNALNYQR